MLESIKMVRREHGHSSSLEIKALLVLQRSVDRKSTPLFPELKRSPHKVTHKMIDFE